MRTRVAEASAVGVADYAVAKSMKSMLMTEVVAECSSQGAKTSSGLRSRDLPPRSPWSRRGVNRYALSASLQGGDVNILAVGTNAAT